MDSLERRPISRTYIFPFFPPHRVLSFFLSIYHILKSVAYLSILLPQTPYQRTRNKKENPYINKYKEMEKRNLTLPEKPLSEMEEKYDYDDGFTNFIVFFGVFVGLGILIWVFLRVNR